jgi:sugar transferase (PEP-CTERM/EpsH1 system associated)
MSRPHEILVLSHLVPWPTTSGVLLRCYHLLRQAARHHRVHLFALNQEVLLPAAAVADSVRHLASFCAEVQVFPLAGAGSRARYASQLALNTLSPQPYSIPRFYSPELEAAVIDCLARRPIQLVQFETLAMAQYGALAPDLPAILVHQNHESALMARRSERARNPLARLYLGLQARKLAAYEASICRAQAANVTVSEEDRAALAALAPGAHFCVVPNGVDTELFVPAPDPGGAELVFVGGMSWYPNRDAMRWFLAEIWPAVRRTMPLARLTIVGSHPAPEVRRAEARGEGVTATDLVPDIRPYVERAAVYVCPLRVGGGTRLKILDAWAMGKAVVSTPIGAEGLAAVDGRDLVLAETPTAFAHRILELLADPARRQALGEAGRRRVEAEFAWPRVARPLLGLYDELVTAHQEGDRGPGGLGARSGDGLRAPQPAEAMHREAARDPGQDVGHDVEHDRPGRPLDVLDR